MPALSRLRAPGHGTLVALLAGRIPKTQVFALLKTRKDYPVKYRKVTTYTTNVSVVYDYFRSHPPKYKGLTVFFQHEHNLVLPGSWDIGVHDPVSVVASISDPSEKYYVRIINKPRYYYSDIVIEYNQPNIENIVRSAALPPKVTKKIVYAPSLPFEYSNSPDRPLPLMTNFNDNDWDPRRGRLCERLLEVCPEYKNVQGVYEYSDLRDLYSSAKVMVNAHQTRFHHSVEEFRILPALSQGCVVVSEDVPLRETIPYHEYVVWAAYEDLADVTAEVLADYDGYFERIHGKDSGLPALLQGMKDEFAQSMTKLLDDDKYFSRAARMRRRALGVVIKTGSTVRYKARRYFRRFKGWQPPE